MANPGLLVVLLLTFGGLGMLVACAYLGAIAELVRESKIMWISYVGRIGHNSLRLAGYLLMVLVAAFTLGPLAFLIIGLASLASPALGGLSGTVALSVVLWLMIYLFFAEEAIFMDNVNPLRAIWYSANVVYRNFWSAVGLFFITNVILLGMSIALSLLFVHPLGVLASMVVNSYIASGLAAAAMIYCQQRSRIWLESKVAPNGAR